MLPDDQMKSKTSQIKRKKISQEFLFESTQNDAFKFLKIFKNELP